MDYGTLYAYVYVCIHIYRGCTYVWGMQYKHYIDCCWLSIPGVTVSLTTTPSPMLTQSSSEADGTVF